MSAGGGLWLAVGKIRPLGCLNRICRSCQTHAADFRLEKEREALQWLVQEQDGWGQVKSSTLARDFIEASVWVTVLTINRKVRGFHLSPQHSYFSLLLAVKDCSPLLLSSHCLYSPLSRWVYHNKHRDNLTGGINPPQEGQNQPTDSGGSQWGAFFPSAGCRHQGWFAAQGGKGQASQGTERGTGISVQ